MRESSLRNKDSSSSSACPSSNKAFCAWDCGQSNSERKKLSSFFTKYLILAKRTSRSSRNSNKMGLFNFLKKGDADKELDISPILPEEVYKSAVLDLKDIIAPPAIKITPKQLNLGEKIVRSFFVISYPRFLTEGWFSPIINLDKVFDVSIFIHPVETAKILRQFQKKVAEVQSQIQTREEKGLVRDPMLDTAYRDLEQLRDDLQQANEKIFDVGLYISLYAETEEELNKIESEMKSLLEARLVYVKPALFQQEECFKSVIPICTDKMEVHSKLNSSPLSSVFPFTSFDLTSDR